MQVNGSNRGLRLRFRVTECQRMPNLPTRDFPPGIEPLGELALDLRWTWSHEADALWERVDAEAWGRTRNPWTILQDISAERLRALAADASFVAELERLAGTRRAYLDAPSWFSSAHGAAALSGVAYFSMEFGLGEGLPLYAGGLGILAGDFLKTASDLGIPVIGVGLLYQEGYFRQIIDATGAARGLSVQRPGFDANRAGAGTRRIVVQRPSQPTWADPFAACLASARWADQAVSARRQRPT
jgi:hypothetical protein